MLTGPRRKKWKRNDDALHRQWREDSERRSTDGRRLWRCWQCDSLGPWTKTHGGYYSYAQVEDGEPFPVWCSTACRDALVVKQMIPLNLKGG